MKPASFVAWTLIATLLSACATEPVSDPATSGAVASSAVAKPFVVVYKSPTCGCCAKWEEHLRASGYDVESRPSTDMSTVKADLDVPSELASCHTGMIEGYVLEGHVPAEAIDRLLRERPTAKGLFVPGMPAGSPGMEVLGQEASYDVLLLGLDGTTSVYLHMPIG